MTVLTTARLTLAPPTAADLTHIMDLRTEPSVVQFMGGRASTQEECWARLLKYVGHWSAFGFGYWMVRENQTGRFLGEVGIAYQRRTNMPDGKDDPEAGWGLLPWARGKGYGNEALTAALDWSDRRFERTVCLIDPRNHPSLKLAALKGYQPFGQTSLEGSPMSALERRWRTRDSTT